MSTDPSEERKTLIVMLGTLDPDVGEESPKADADPVSITDFVMMFCEVFSGNKDLEWFAPDAGRRDFDTVMFRLFCCSYVYARSRPAEFLQIVEHLRDSKDPMYEIMEWNCLNIVASQVRLYMEQKGIPVGMPGYIDAIMERFPSCLDAIGDLFGDYGER